MPTVNEIRASIDEMLDRWEAAATALEHSANATVATVSEGVDAQKRKASAAVKAVREAVSKLADLPEEVRKQATAAADRVRAELNRTNQQTLEAARSQRDTIEAAFHDLHERLDTFGEKADTELQKAALSLLLAERELELKTELALVRYAASHVDDAVALNKSREEMSEQFAAFRRSLDEHRKAAVGKGKEFAESLAPMFNRAKSAFVKAYEEFTKET